MNYGVIIYILGMLMRVESILLLFPFTVGLIYREDTAWSYLFTAACCFILGFAMSFRKPKKGGLYLKEGYFVVALGWILMSLLGAVPFVITREIPNYINALFETISGFTTTGATILADVECLSHATLFWRSFLHLIGGMGVFVFLSGLIPALGGNQVNLMKAESTGPSVDKLVPRMKDTVMILYSIYLIMGLTETLLLLIFGLDLFESLTLTFGTIGTGGFGILNSSIGSYSPAVQWTIGIFMLMSGMNYALYFHILRRKFKQAVDMEEIRLYLSITLVSVILITINLGRFYSTFGETVRHTFFQVSSLITSTGYATTDFDLWPEFSKTILIVLMLMGACAGSTGGGIKMSRMLILFKAARKQNQIFIHPRAVKKIKMDNSVVDHDAVRATNAYISIFFAVLFVSVLIVSIDGNDFTTNFTSVVATLNNMGPGFNKVGPTCNYSFFSVRSKLVLIFDMLAGRLELFPMLLLISPRSWKTYL